MSLDLEPVSWKIKVLWSFVVFNNAIEQPSVGVPETTPKALPSSLQMQLSTLPPQLTAAHGCSPRALMAAGQSTKTERVGVNPSPATASARPRPSIPPASMAGTQQKMVPRPG